MRLTVTYTDAEFLGLVCHFMFAEDHYHYEQFSMFFLLLIFCQFAQIINIECIHVFF